MSFFSSPPSSTQYRHLQPPPKDFYTSSSSPNAGPVDVNSFSVETPPTIQFPSMNNSGKTLQRPLHRLRNDEISAARHQIPTVYEALVQYDSLYLNAEARMEAKENELTRCIEVGQEVLMQLNVVRQRCSEISDERDAALEGRSAIERQLALLRINMKNMEQSYEDHYRSSSTEATHNNMQLQYEMRQQKEINASLNTQLSENKEEINELNHRCAELEQIRSELLRELAHLREATVSQTRQSRDDLAELASCGAICQGISGALSSSMAAAGAGGVTITSSTNNLLASKPLNSLLDMRTVLQEVHRQASIVREHLGMERSKRIQVEGTLDATRQEKEYAISEATALRANLVQLRDGCQRLESELQRVKEDKMESPKRLLMLQSSIEDKDRSLQDSHRTTTSLQLELASKSQRVIHLEQHVHDLQRDLQSRDEQADHASRAAEAMHRARLAEQTIAQLHAEVAKHKLRIQQLTEVEGLLEGQAQKYKSLELHCEAMKRQDQVAQDDLASKQRELDSLTETLSAVQSDLYEAQGQRTRALDELTSAHNTLRDFEAEILRLKASASLATELKTAREENSQLREALETIQQESRELHDALSRVALEEQQTSTSMITRIQSLETDLEEKNRKCSEQSVTERQLKQQLRELSIKEAQLQETVDEQKKRVADLLHSQVPKVMFQELENDFTGVREDLQRVRSENVVLQEMIDQQKKQAASLESEYSTESRRCADVLDIVLQWDERLKHLEQHQCAGGPINAAKRLERHRSARTSSINGAGGAKGTSAKPLFLDLGSSDSPSPPHAAIVVDNSSIASSSFETAMGGSGSSAVQYSSAARKMLDAFAESTAEQRKLLQVIQERLKSRRTLPPDSVLFASTPQQYVDSVTRWYDVSLQQLDTLVLQANKVAETRSAKATHLEEELVRRQKLIDDLQHANATQTRELESRQAALASAESELDNYRVRYQRLADDKAMSSSETERERSRRSKLEQQVKDYERQLEEVHSSVSFESQSLAARCESLKQTLDSERQEHQSALKKVFEELALLKHDRVRNQSTSHDEYASEVKRRRTAEAERDDISTKLHHTQRVNEELEERVERYASMLQLAREEVENVTATLNDVEANLQRDLKVAEDDKEALHQELQQVLHRKQELQVELQRAEAAAHSAKTSHSDDAATQNKLASLRRDLDAAKGRVAEAQHVIAALEERCRLQQEEIDRISMGSDSEAREVSALRVANEALEQRLRSVENDRDPLRQQLHTLLIHQQQQHHLSSFLESSPPGSAIRRR